MNKTTLVDGRYSVQTVNGLDNGADWLAGPYYRKNQVGDDKVAHQLPKGSPPALERAQDGSIVWGTFLRNGFDPKPSYGMEHDYYMSFEKTDITPGTVFIPEGYWPGFPDTLVTNPTSSRSAWGMQYDPYPGLLVKALGKLREKLSGASFNAAVAVAEAGEAFAMMANRLEKVAIAFYWAKKRQWKKAASVLGISRRPQPRDKVTVHDGWLELQYGWLPMLQDVTGGAEFLAHHLNVPAKKRYKVRASDNGVWLKSLYASGSGKATCGLSLVAIVEEQPNVARLAGLTDPLSLAWERIPFSFVADWVRPVGDWLEARDTVSLLHATYVETHFQRVEYFGRSPNYATGISNSTQISEERVLVDRKVTGSLSLELPRASSLKEMFASSTRLANAVALVTAVASDRPIPKGLIR